MAPHVLGPEPIQANQSFLGSRPCPSLSYPASFVDEVSASIDQGLSESEKLIAHAMKTRIEAIDLETCSPGSEDSFFVADLGVVYSQFMRWKACLPRVTPFYAMKCNGDPKVLELLAALGTGFDCASRNEIQTILDLGVPQDRIIYAHPCKVASYIRYASSVGVEKMVFDNAEELYKCAKYHPTAKLFLRIVTDDSQSLCQFSVKYGAALENTQSLLQLAKDLGLNVAGVSFHVGSGAGDPNAFLDAVRNAKRVFDQGAAIGMKMTTLDVGGGFSDDSFESSAAVLGDALDKYFPKESGVTLMAEPGRFFVSEAFTIASHVIARRIIENQNKAMLYLNDGVYGNMNCILFDHQEPVPKVLTYQGKFMYGERYQKQKTSRDVSVWGPTCDGIDCISKSCQLPVLLDVGDWMYFTSFGAYTVAASTTFNGFNGDCETLYVCSKKEVEQYIKL